MKGRMQWMWALLAAVLATGAWADPGGFSVRLPKKPTKAFGYNGATGNVPFTVSVAGGKRGDTATVEVDVDPDGADWITLNLPDSAVPSLSCVLDPKGTARARLQYRVGGNPAALDRTGTIRINGQPFTVTQKPAPCKVSLSPTTSEVPGAGAQDLTFAVDAPAGCGWSAEVDRKAAAWLDLDSASGTGDGTVVFSAAANSGAARTGRIRVTPATKHPSLKTFTAVQQPAPTAPSLRVIVTDAPFTAANVKSATVRVQEINLHRIDAADDAFETLVTFPAGGHLLDLVQLKNGVVDLLFEGNPPPGDYDAVRIVVVPEDVILDDNGQEKSFPLKVPSGEQTGIKLFVSPAISVVTHLTTELVLDFDLSRSLVMKGNPRNIQGFNFKPVVRAINRSTAGTLTFLVRNDNGTPADASDDPALNNASYDLLDDQSQVVASGVSGPNPDDVTVEGYVFHPAIPAGSYTLQVTYPDHDPYVKTPVVIDAANLTDLGTVTLARTRGSIAGAVTASIQTRAGDSVSVPVSGATVEAGGVSTATDNAGLYVLADLPVGPHTVTVKKEGYDDATADGISWAAGDPLTSPTNVLLVRLLGSVIGTVTDSQGGALPNATVRASVDAGGAWVVVAEVPTDAAGRYTLTLPSASYQLEASLGAASATRLLEFVGGTATAVVADVTIL